MTEMQHIPVMLGPVLELLDPKPGENFLDCTLGGGGHSKAILEKTASKGKLYGIDRDPFALKQAAEKLKEFADRTQFFHGEFSNVAQLIPQEIFSTLNGAMIDCGVSSFQLDSQERGFSFRYDSKLDMRMNTTTGMSAREFLHQTQEQDLANAIYELGEERNSRKIAKNIVDARRNGQLETTFDLVKAVEKSFPPRLYNKIHPATRTFQAIRMKINDELGEIEQGIQGLVAHMPSGSKIVVITFHSLEDRLVKHAFRQLARDKKVKLLVKKPVAATREEARENPRSRSAKVRALELA
jgi:16S rRNA (cytosine1402-N4)-methyltransferase